MRSSGWWFLAWICMLPVGCGDPGYPLISYRSLPIVGGAVDSSAKHRAVVAIATNLGFCSGTLISPRVVLTAGHCVEGVGTGGTTVLFGTNIYSAQSRGVSQIAPHPEYSPGTETIPPGKDIALLRLSSDAPAGVVPIPHLPEHLKITSGDINTTLEFVGFGETDSGGFGTKMTVFNQLDWICTDAEGCLFASFLGAENTICQDQDPGGPCGGDSGGPALIMRGGVEYVAGVTSYGDLNCDVFGCSAKVDAYQKFIADFVGRVLGAACRIGSDCDSGFCSQGVCCDLACDGPCESCQVVGSLGVCTVLPNYTPCSDDNVCNGEETCLFGSCSGGKNLDCRDDDPCTKDECDPKTGCQFTPVEDGASCPDADACNGIEVCVEGICKSGSPLDCDDLNPCTLDSCDPSLGCRHAAAAEGGPCGGGACGDSSCINGECIPDDPVACDDQNSCTLDVCSSDNTCNHLDLADHTPCGDCRWCQSAVCTEEPDCSSSEGCGCGLVGSAAETELLAWLILACGILVSRKDRSA